jgi:uroporphyrin-III C-methyltransferase
VSETSGKVYLIGAGPGDPQLMTLKAARALSLADVVLVDALVNWGCLAHARSDARIIEVGKRAGSGTSQAFVEKLCIQHAKAGQTVARLKGGDPFVFGRGGEELRALVEEGIAIEVIPGITAGTAVPAMFGIPVTHRDFAHGVTFITGHGAQVNWQALVRSRTTLVIYMGLRNLANIANALKAAGMEPRKRSPRPGWPPQTPPPVAGSNSSTPARWDEANFSWLMCAWQCGWPLLSVASSFLRTSVGGRDA